MQRVLSRRITTFVVLPIILICTSAASETRILLVGDSWAQSIWVTGLLDKALADASYENVFSAGDTTALGGTRADQWITPEYRKKIQQALATNPTVDIIYLIIGGNDVLRRIRDTNVFENQTDEQRHREWDAIARNIRRIVTYCLEYEQIRHVVLAGYDYLNPKTAKEVFELLGQDFHFGGMTQEQVNACFIEHERRKRDVAHDLAGCTYIHNLGLMHYHFNEPPDVSPPGGPPDYDPFPGGDPTRPMPDKAFPSVALAGNNYPGDGIHPNEEAHLIMLQNAITTAIGPLLEESADPLTSNTTAADSAVENVLWDVRK